MCSPPNGITWTQQTKLTPTDYLRPHYFSRSVAVDGDMVVVVGTESGDGQSTPWTLSASVFTRNGTTWTQQAQLTAGRGPNAALAGPVAVDGHTVVVGNEDEDDHAGSVYVVMVPR